MSAGIVSLKQFAHVDCSYNLTPADLLAKAAVVDAIIVRSATKVRSLREVLDWSALGPPSSPFLFERVFSKSLSLNNEPMYQATVAYARLVG